MQILLLQPWVEDFYSTDCRIQPIGLAYLAGSLKQRFPDWDIQIFDALANGEKKTIPWPQEFRYLKRYYGHPDSGPFSLFHHYYRFGHSDDAILRRLAQYQPFLIGISSLFTPYYRQSLALARLCKKVFPRVPIVMGGNHATLHPQTLLCPQPPFRSDEQLCDFVLRGECEESICELVDHLLGRRRCDEVSNVVTAADVRGLHGEQKDVPSPALGEPRPPRRESLPFPDFNGLKLRDYLYGNQPMTFLVTSRSCPHRCTFCSIHAVFGRHYETRPVGDIIEEIQRRYAEGIRHFDIEDDNFTFHNAHTHELLDRLLAERLPVTFSAMNGLSYISLDQELLGKMRQAGFDSLNLALVSSDLMVLKFTQRPHTLERFREVLNWASSLSFKVTAYFIAGMPGQTIEEMWRTLGVLAESQCLIGASPFYFTPGSPIHLRERGSPAIKLASDSLGGDRYLSARLSALDLEHSDFDRDDVYTCFRMTRVVNYIKSGLDRGLAPEDAYFEPAHRVFSGGAWFAQSRAGAAALPFSRRIRDLMLRTPLRVRGYKTAREMTFPIGNVSTEKHETHGNFREIPCSSVEKSF